MDEFAKGGHVTESGLAGTTDGVRSSDRTLALRGVEFVKMTGSGNDFVFFDGRTAPSEVLTSPDVIAAICNRHNGIGADGIVIIEPLAARSGLANGTADPAPDGREQHADARIRYFNSDGSPADLCGNATLCSTRLAVELGVAPAAGMGLLTPAGVIRSRLDADGPEIDLQAVTDVQGAVRAIEKEKGELRIGFAKAGIPHLVVLCEDADAVDLASRGPVLRRHPALGEAGANVNWVSARADGTWRYRTFERGVEGETLACGTGAVATAVLLDAWALAADAVTIRTSAERDLRVRLRSDRGEPDSTSILPSLRGEGRVVFRGRIETLVL